MYILFPVCDVRRHFVSSRRIRTRTPIFSVPCVSASASFRVLRLLNFSTVTHRLTPTHSTQLRRISRRVLIGRFQVFLHIFRRIQSKACRTRITRRRVSRLQRFISTHFSRSISPTYLTQIVLNDLRQINLYIRPRTPRLVTMRLLIIRPISFLFRRC